MLPGPTTPKSKKKKNKKRQPKPVDSPANGQQPPDQDSDDNDPDGIDQSPAVRAHTHSCHLRTHANSLQKSSSRDDPDTRPSTAQSESQTNQPNGANSHQPAMDKDTTDRLDALAKERDELREEVTQLRKSLETIQSKHDDEKHGLEEKADEAVKSKEHAEAQYRDLRGKVNTIKAQLGERMRQDAEELERLRSQVDDLDDQNRQLRDDNDQLREQSTGQDSEISTLRSRATLSQQNWIKERDELVQREAYAREEFETAKQAMQDWEVLAMEERSLRENLGDRVAELDDQLNSQREILERAVNERDTQTSTVDGLQRALRDIQDGQPFPPISWTQDFLWFDLTALCSTQEGTAGDCREFADPIGGASHAASGRRNGLRESKDGARDHAKGTREGPTIREGGQGEEPAHWKASS